MSTPRHRLSSAICAVCALWLAACSGEPRQARVMVDKVDRDDQTAERAGGDSEPQAGSGPDTSQNPVIARSQAPDSGMDQRCAKQTSRATRQPVYLEFAFDVSGSMGKGDKPWHDRKLKWEPVVAATKAFFEDAKSEGFSAALTFFPSDAERCDKGSYLAPDVDMQPLPSTKFGEALDAVGREEWRGGTPTLYVTQGIFDQIDREQRDHPGRYALVLVTDGYPQDCDDDSIDSVAELVKSRAESIPTYVIGVQNPPIEDAPDVTTNLADIARAGGSGNAYLIDTGDPTQTVSAFKHTIDEIRSAAVSCMLAIPAAPQGQTFDKQKVSVRYLSGMSQTALSYDAECKGASTWHYDDPTSPRELVLCPDTCKALQGDENAELVVDFECEPVILL